MKIDSAVAIQVLRKAAEKAEKGPLDAVWIKKLEEFSRLCDEGVSKTHIAFLGTAILAKSVNRYADLFAIKPEHAPGNPNAFSARTLCHSVLVPLSAELSISIGVTGREPLNNQPYFRMTHLDDGTPIHAGARKAFDYMIDLVRLLQEMPDEAAARLALEAFIVVRRKHQRSYVDHDGTMQITPDRLAGVIRALVLDNSEGGRRAQAAVAGLMDVVAGSARVESGRINDPSRKYPGDVCVRSIADPTTWEKAIEVRDKPVTMNDVQIFGKKCVDMNVREAAVVMVAENQPPLDQIVLNKWANGLGIGVTLFHGWDQLVNQMLFWSPEPKPVAAVSAIGFIHQRLTAVEASPEALKLWQKLLVE